MLNPELLQPSFRELSKLIISLFLIVIAISCYMIQRSFIAFFMAQFADSEFSDLATQNMASQAQFGGLKFQYGTMNILWPVILLILFLIVKLLMQKQAGIWEGLRKSKDHEGLEFDALNLYRQILVDRIGRIVLFISAYLPLLALLAHLVAGAWLYYIFIKGNVTHAMALHILKPQALLQVMVSMAALGLAMGVPQLLLRIVAMYRCPPQKQGKLPIDK